MKMRHRGDIRMQFKILRALITALVLLSTSNSALAIAGKVIYSFGQVEGFGADGVTRPLVLTFPRDTGHRVKNHIMKMIQHEVLDEETAKDSQSGIQERGGGGKPKIFSPLTLLGFQVVDSYCFQSTACEIAVGSCRSASRVV